MKPPGVWRFDLARTMSLVWDHRFWFARTHIVVGSVALATVLLLPRWYASSVTLVPAPKDGLGLDLTGTSALMGNAGLGLGLQPTPQDQLRMVLKSRAVADSLVNAFSLQTRWHLRHRLQARERLAEHTTITTPKEGQVLVTVEAREPALARAVTAAYARYAASEGIRLKSSLATQRRAYLESRLAELEGEITRASERLRRFEEKNRALSLPDQARQTVDAYGTLRSQVVLLETEMAAARRYFTEQSPEVVSLRDRIGELERQLGRLAHEGGALLPKGDDLPALRQQYLAYMREQASLVAVGEVLRRVYEQARVEEANPVPTFSVLDAAEMPERHSRPRRGLILFLALGLTTVGSLSWLVWRDQPSSSPVLASPPAQEARAA
jgi:tyrosine-protein kinase Etk/Wzc